MSPEEERVSSKVRDLEARMSRPPLFRPVGAFADETPRSQAWPHLW